MTSTTLYDESGVQARQVTSSYGAEGEVLGQSGSTEPATMGYDAAYRMISLKDGNNQQTTWTYSSAGNLDTMTFPGGQTVKYTSYNANGAPLVRLDGNNAETDFTYSSVDSRLTDVQYPASTGLNIHLEYDSYGRTTSRTDGSGTFA